jgi:hypothetical protein
MKHHEHPAWNQGRNASHAPQRDRDIVMTLGLILASTFAPIGLVWLVVAAVKGFA